MDVTGSGLARGSLESALLLLKTAHGKAAVELIKSVTAADGIYVFKDILTHPNVQSLRQTSDAAYVTLLELFSYGTVAQYRGYHGLPALDDRQLRKLRQLSLVSVCMYRSIVPYQDLLSELQLSDMDQLEDLVLDAISKDIIQAKLDQRAARIEVISTMGRDLAPGEKDDLLRVLYQWQENATDLLSQIDEKLAQSARDRKNTREAEKSQKAAVAKVTQRLEDEAKSGGRGHQSSNPDGTKIKGKASHGSRKRDR